MNSETIRSTIETWVNTIGAEGVRQATTVTYKGHMQVFLKGLRNDDLTPFTLRRFFAEYREGRSPHSVRSVYTTVRTFLKFAVAEGLADEVAVADLDQPETLGVALEGAYGVFANTNSFAGGDTDEVTQGTAAVEAAKAAGVEHYIW